VTYSSDPKFSQKTLTVVAAFCYNSGMKINQTSFRSVCGKIQFAVRNDPLAAGTYETIAGLIAHVAGIPVTAREAWEYVSGKRPANEMAQSAICAFAEEHGIHG
jgi:hypothetical protein